MGDKYENGFGDVDVDDINKLRQLSSVGTTAQYSHVHKR